MPQTPYIERHFTGSATVRDIVLGMSDGLTVPFAEFRTNGVDRRIGRRGSIRDRTGVFMSWAAK